MEFKNIPARNSTTSPLVDTDWVMVKNQSGDGTWIQIPSLKTYNPAGINGKNPEFSWVDPWLRYRLVGDVTWVNLVPKADIIGPQGIQGIQGNAGNQGVQGDPGLNGRNPEFESNLTHLRWRLVDDVTWINLVALSAITGPQGIQGDTGAQGDPGQQGDPGGDGSDGKNPELGVSATHIHWRLVGDIPWINLVALSTLKGDPGDQGIQGEPGDDGDNGSNPEFQFGTTHFQWRLVGDVTWLDLATKASMTGPQGIQGETGAAGENGKSVEMRKDTTHIQWKLIGDATWINIVALTEIKGDQGIQGEAGEQGEQGVQGNQGTAGRNIQYHTTDVTLTPANFGISYFAGDLIKLT